MEPALRGIIEESREHYQRRKQSLIGEILGLPKGALKCRSSAQESGSYCYLHCREGHKVIDIYLGKTDEISRGKSQQSFHRKKSILKEIAIVRKSLRLLRVKTTMIDREDFIDPLRRVFQEFEKLGLWEAGLELVGSWCFKVYQNHLGVESFPLRTVDADIAIPVPYKGPETDLGSLLRDIGFQADFRPNGAVFYVGFGMIIDLISPDKGRGAKNGKIYIRGPCAPALALRYLQMLLENKTILKIHGVGKIAVPSMPAFMLHKLLIAPLRSEGEKQARDYRQVHALAKRIFADEDLLRETAAVLRGLPGRWFSRMEASAKTMKDHLPEDQQSDITPMLLTRVLRTGAFLNFGFRSSGYL